MAQGNYTKTIRISRTDYDTLYANGAKTGSIVKGGVTYTWDEHALYLIQDSIVSLDSINAVLTDVTVPN
jgi:hypothetical protein